MVRGRDKFRRFKPIIMVFVKLLKIFPLRFRGKLFKLVSTIKGNVGLVIRYALLKSIAKNCGDNVSIHPNVHIFNPENLSIGNNVSIHPMCYIDAAGEITIGNDVSIAHGTTIMSSTHQYHDYDTVIKDQPVDLLKTIVEDNVWVAAKVTILGGIHIKSGCVLAAGAVVTKNVDKNSIVGGVPAKKIKLR